MLITLCVLLSLVAIALIYLYFSIRKELLHAKETISLLQTIQQSTIKSLAAADEYSASLQLQLNTLVEDYNSRLEAWKNNAEVEIRADANKRSRSVLRGQATEHLAPLLISEWNHKDYRFLGSPIDYLICAGSSAVTDGIADVIDEIVLLDIKTGKSDLTKVQRRIRDAIENSRIRFCTYHPDEEKLQSWKPIN